MRPAKRSLVLDASIEIASMQLVRTDMAYHAQLEMIERLKSRGLDTSHREKILGFLKEQLERNHAWLRSLQSI